MEWVWTKFGCWRFRFLEQCYPSLVRRSQRLQQKCSWKLSVSFDFNVGFVIKSCQNMVNPTKKYIVFDKIGLC